MDTENRRAAAAPELSNAAISALRQGNKIEAIKIVRMEQNIGLKEAKDAVEDYVRSHPALEASLATAQAGTKRSALVWLAVLVVLVLLGYQFLVKQ